MVTRYDIHALRGATSVEFDLMNGTVRFAFADELGRFIGDIRSVTGDNKTIFNGDASARELVIEFLQWITSKQFTCSERSLGKEVWKAQR